MAGEIRVLIADDHAAVADSLSFTLAQWYDVLTPVYSLRALAAPTWEPPPPDVVLLDLSFGSDSALAILPSLIERHRDVAFVIYTMYNEAILAEGALSAGASGYVVKTCGLEELRSVIDGAAEGLEMVCGLLPSTAPPPNTRCFGRHVHSPRDRHRYFA